MATVTKKLTNSDDELYCKYQNETSRQPVRLCLNIESGELSAYYWANIGAGQTMRSFHGIDIEWDIPPLRVSALESLMDEIEDKCQTILDGSESVWDGSNHVGRLDEDAKEAALGIEELLHSYQWEDSDVYEVWDASVYFAPVDALEELGLSASSTDEEIRKAAEGEVSGADVALDVDDVEQYLRELRDEAEEDG